MAVLRKRLYFWIIKAYIRKWGKVLLFSFVIGLIFFFLLLNTTRFLLRFLPLEQKTSVGIVGAYTIENLPMEITKRLSRGLTKQSSDGAILPDVAKSWDIQNNGKKYIFHLRDDVYFSDGKRLTAKNIPYEFSGVKKEVINDTTITYTLQDSYAPFLVTVSRPMLRKGYIGLGEAIIQNVELNSNFVKTLTTFLRKNRYIVNRYSFYPSEESLKISFALGEIDQANGLTNDVFMNTKFSTYPNVKIEKKTNYKELVTLFYNTKDSVLSDAKVRKSLTYALPETFPLGLRSHIPYAPISKFANKELAQERQDIVHAKALLDAGKSNEKTKTISVTIKTLEKYKNTAKEIADAWKSIGIITKIEEVDSVPDSFQVYLGDFVLPRDPDQYTLWHSASPNNITGMKNLRVDKLLEDGRKITDQTIRVQLYRDFQKYLLEESPAAFLYFPFEYTITRK